MSRPKPRIVPFEMAHLSVMDIRDFEQASMTAGGYETLVEKSVCGTMVFDGRVIAVIGYMELWPQCIEVWVIPSVYVPMYRFVFLRTLRSYLTQLFQPNGFMRIQCPQFITSNLDHWMEHLGFQCEGIMRKYWNGQDMKLWAHVNDQEGA